MLKLKVLLTKMAEMLKNLSDNKVDMTSPIYNYNDNAGTDSDDYDLKTAINNLNWINNIAVDPSNPIQISVKKIFTEILKRFDFNTAKEVANISGSNALPNPRLGYYNSTTRQMKEGYGSNFKLIQVGKLVTLTAEFHASGTTNVPNPLLDESTIMVLPRDIAPSSAVYVPAVYQKADGSILIWRVELKGYNDFSGSYVTISIPSNLLNQNLKRVFFSTNWIVHS